MTNAQFSHPTDLRIDPAEIEQHIYQARRNRQQQLARLACRLLGQRIPITNTNPKLVQQALLQAPARNPSLPNP